jgi:hypothetical protein
MDLNTTAKKKNLLFIWATPSLSHETMPMSPAATAQLTHKTEVDPMALKGLNPSSTTSLRTHLNAIHAFQFENSAVPTPTAAFFPPAPPHDSKHPPPAPLPPPVQTHAAAPTPPH